MGDHIATSGLALRARTAKSALERGCAMPQGTASVNPTLRAQLVVRSRALQTTFILCARTAVCATARPVSVCAMTAMRILGPVVNTCAAPTTAALTALAIHLQARAIVRLALTAISLGLALTAQLKPARTTATSTVNVKMAYASATRALP